MAVDSVAANATPQITGALRQAASSTGISFEYLLTTAQIESNLNPAAQASTSSAKGLYQFIEQTWLATLKDDGPAHGFGRYADAIVRSPDGRYDVADPTMRAAIMRLRSDPSASATMAGAFARHNAEQLTAAIGRQPSEGELYIAHFLGSEGAGKLIAAAATQPRVIAADMFPQAAAANPGIFLDSAGHPASAGEVYSKLTARFEFTRAISFAPVVTSAAVPMSPDTAGVTEAYAQAKDDSPPLPDTKPLFQAMFTDRARRAAGQAASGQVAPSNVAATAAAAPVRPLNLFTDAPADTPKLFNGKF
jgi:hypothetical protein